MVITKREDVTKQGSCENTLKKTPSSGKSLISFSTYSIFGGCGGRGGLFEFEWEGGGVGAYSRWALIRGWALIRINTVYSR